MPAAMRMNIGLTPTSHISTALAMGIQQLTSEMPALFAMVKVGTAINATTAGRMPRNIAAIQLTSMKRWKKMAMSRMMRNEGNAVPKLAQRAPRIFLSL